MNDNVEWTLLKKDGDLQEAATETNSWHHMQQWFVEAKGEHTEVGSRGSWLLDQLAPLQLRDLR